MFKLLHKDTNCNARAGELKTKRSTIKTPVFMPVGTRATVKTLSSEELNEIGFDIILSNTYHLCLRPGIDVLKEFKGIHRFMNWDKSILTDSGGFQVFSLASFRKITEKGIIFRSHIDGKQYEFTPENVLDMQKIFGVDIAMVLDECIPYPCDEKYAKQSTDMTVRWAKQAKEYMREDYPYVFSIVQGGVYKKLRQECANRLVEMDFPGYAIGGLSVGEERDLMNEMVGVTVECLPENKPRYLMGVGDPIDIINSVEQGVDMFDCVMATRNARHGCLFTFNGKVSIEKAKHAFSDKKIDEQCNCYVCRNYSAGYLHHLFRTKELLGLKLNTYHNLSFFYNLMNSIRTAIIENRFLGFKEEFLRKYLK